MEAHRPHMFSFLPFLIKAPFSITRSFYGFSPFLRGFFSNLIKNAFTTVHIFNNTIKTSAQRIRCRRIWTTKLNFLFKILLDVHFKFLGELACTHEHSYYLKGFIRRTDFE